MFEGAYTALVTPFKNEKIDYDALEKHIEFQIKEGIDGVIPMGTTGESPRSLLRNMRNLSEE
jgi:4-hydroxy-tetrahydrodipicolinate synthase